MATDNINVYLDQVNTPLIAEMTAMLQLIGVSFFMYYVNFTDGSEIKCTNRPDWTRYFVEKQCYRHSQLTLPPATYQPGFYLLDEIENPAINTIRITQFHIEQVVVAMNPVAAGCEMVFFGSDGHQPMLSFYLNNLPLLRQFIVYFKNRLSPHLRALEATRLVIPNRLEDRTPHWTPVHGGDGLTQFQQQITIKKFHLGAEYAGNKITARELEVLRELVTGDSYKLIASRLHISPRTVETHLSKLKQKLSCHSRDALRQFFISHFV